MPSMTQHAPPPVSLLSKDEKTASISPRSPPYSPPRPVAPNQPSRDSPPPPSKTASLPTNPAVSKADVKSSTQSEATVEEPKGQPADDDEEEPEADDEPIDMDTFNQILELDDEDEDDREFSRGMVFEYFAQVEKTFKDLDESLEKRDLGSLSSLGHYLKGSSAALGVTHVQASCEKIQHYGALRDEEKDLDLSEEEALNLIRRTLALCKREYAVADKWLRAYYNELADR